MTTTINNEHKKLNVPNSTDKGNVIRNVPNLRFPEFEEEWENCKLGDACNVFMCKRILASQTNTDGGVPFYKIGTIGSTPDTYISKELFDDYKEKYNYPHKGEVMITCAGTVGKCVVYDGKDAYYQDSNIVWIDNPSQNISNGFLYHLMANVDWRKLNSTTIIRIYNDDLKNLKLNYPKKEEQQKISKLLTLLDERIATQNKIIDKLQSLIKGIADNILDNPLWKKTYLRSFMQFFSTNSLSWEQLSYEEGEIRNLHYGLIHGFLTRGINSVSLPMIKNEAIPKQYTLCQVGDVAFADASEDTGEIAKSVEFVDTIEGDTICGLHTIHGRDIKNRTVVGFKGFAFNSRYFHNQIKRLAQGTKVFSITANNLSSCYVYLPDLEKQKAIVKLLRSYEKQLIIGRMILKQYEKQKQYLLRQMFI